MKVEPIKYSSGGTTFAGALVYDDKVTRPRPAVLMAPNWMGMTDKAVERGSLIAGDKYVVLVADMYGEGRRPKDFGEAAALANPLRADAPEARKRIGAALDALISEGNKRKLISGHRAAVGFCFGGGNVLELARAGADIAAVVSIHGDLTSPVPATKGAIKAKLLVTHGAPDPVAPKAQRDAFEAEMDTAGTQWQMLVFSGVLHAYTDQGMDVPNVAGWNEPATRYTYTLMNQFIDDAFAAKL